MLTKSNFKCTLHKVHNGLIEAIDDYIDDNTEIRFYCHVKDEYGNEHGEFIKTPNEVINLKHSCDKCQKQGCRKPFGYWNIKENCIEEAKKYNTKYKLQKKCIGCYNSFFRNNWVDDLLNIYQNSIKLYSNPEDKIHSIYVYDIKEFNACYVGRTKNIQRRDRQHRNGYGHSDGTIEYDHLWKFCNEHGIEMPTPLILEEGLNAEESQIKENEWLMKYVSDGYNPINIAPTGKNLGSLGATLKWTYEACKEEAKKYNSKQEMRLNNPSAHRSALRNGWIYEFFEHAKKEDGYWKKIENLQHEASKCKNVKEFALKCGGAYNAARKNGVLDKLQFQNPRTIRRPLGFWNDKQNCIDFCKDYKTLKELREASYACYESLKRNGWEHELFPTSIMKECGHWNNKVECIKEARKYENIAELQDKCYGCYMGLKRNGWLDEAFHKPINYWRDKQNCVNEISKYKTKKEFITKSKSCYNAVREQGWLEELCSGYSKDVKYRDINSPIHVVYVYEMTDFNTCYIGRTVNLHTRDLSHRRGKKHKDGTITYNALYKFCKEKQIDIPMPKILEENLTGEESLIKEDEYLTKYKLNGWNTLNIAKTGKDSGSLGAVMKWDYDTCKEFAKNYKYKSELQKANCTCYNQCLKNGWFEEFGIIDKKEHPNGTWNNIDKCKEEISKYKNISDIVNNCHGLYRAIKRNGWDDLLEGLNCSNNPNLNFEEIYKTYKEVGNVADVINIYHTSYQRIKRLFQENNVRFDGHKDVYLSKEDEIKIHDLVKEGKSLRSVSKMYKIDKKRVKRIYNTYESM